jgi:hypothetical protein
MEANRGESAMHGNLLVKDLLPKPEPTPDWNYLDTVAKERMAA